MKKHLYIIYDSLLLIIVSIIFLIFTIHNRNNPILIIGFIVSKAYFISNIWKGICLIADIIIGCQKKRTVFLGVFDTNKLDWFRVEYTYIYFDDDEMSKDYIAFDDSIEETIKQGDKIEVEYYKHSRVVLSIKKLNDDSVYN